MPWAGDNLSASQREREFQDLLARAGRQVTSTSEGGRNLICRCPLPGHEDRNPSFGYHLDKDLYACASCGGGNLVTLYAKIHGLSDGDAIRALKAKYLGQEPSPAGDRRATGNSGARPQGAAAPSPPPAADLVIPEADWKRAKPLPADWREVLAAKRGWTPEALAAQDVRLFVNEDDRRLPYVAPPGRVAIPVRDTAGRLRNVRLYLPGAPEGQTKIYSWYNGRQPNKVSYGAPSRPWPAPNTWPTGVPLWLTEGEPDCLAALSLGLAAVTKTAGVSQRLREMVNHLRGRRVVIAYDADLPGISGALRDAQDLLQVGSTVRVVLWPGEMLAQPPGDDPEAAARAAKERAKALKQAQGLGLAPADLERLAAYIEALPSTHGQDLTDAHVKHGLARADLEALAAAGPLLAPHPAPSPPAGQEDLIEDPEAMLALKAFSTLDNKFAFRALLLGRRLLREQRIVTCRITKITYLYNGKVWRPALREDIARLVSQHLGLATSRNKIQEAVDMVIMHSMLPEGQEMDADERHLCCQNGMLDLDTGALLPHAPEYLCSYMFPWDWTPRTPPDCREIKRFLGQTVQVPEVIAEMQEFAGYALWPGQHFKKALLLIGPGDDGKSKFIALLRAMVGEENCSSVNLADLEDQFQRVMLYRKMLNTYGEASSNFFANEAFKVITGGDALSAAYKHKDGFSFTTRAKLVFSANSFPRVRDTSEAFYGRILPVQFRRRFIEGDPDRDPHIWDKLAPELPGFFHWALVGLFRLRRRGGFSPSPTTQAYLDAYRYENNHVLQFLQQRCVFGASPDGVPHEIMKSALYTAYMAWCKDNGHKPMPSNSLLGQVPRLKPGITSVRPAAPHPGAARPPYHFRGLDLASNWEAA